jgi:hypothetical protein
MESCILKKRLIDYKKNELYELAKKCFIKNIRKYKKEELFDLIHKIYSESTTPINEEECLRKTLTECKFKISKKKIESILKMIKGKSVIIPTQINDISFGDGRVINTDVELFDDFINYFEEEFMSFIKNPEKKPLMKAFVPGGYGLNMLFEHKYKEGKIKTSDLDITISINDTMLTATECKQHLLNKCKKFINSRKDPGNYHITEMNFQTHYNPLLKMRRFSLISILYKNEDFVDLVITDREIHLDEINKQVSLKCNLPIKKDEGYLFEYFQIIYMENVPGIDNYCYLKRNPVTGVFKCKGKRDIERVTMLCNLSKSKKYEEYCKIAKKINTSKLKRIGKIKRDALFLRLRSIL